jgi:hypothetical protein
MKRGTSHISLRKIIESIIHEDDEAKQKGWKHIAFGTYEDQSGNRFKRDASGSWQPVGTKQGGAQPQQQPAAPTATQQPGQPASTSAPKPEPRQDIAKMVAPLIDRQAISAVEDEDERKFYTAMADVAEIDDDDKFRETLRSGTPDGTISPEDMSQLLDFPFSDAINRRANDGLKHLDTLSSALEDMQRQNPRYRDDMGQMVNDLRDGKDLEYTSDVLLGLRTALGHDATEYARNN